MPGFTNHNKWNLTGTITSGLTLSPTNADAGSIPSGVVTYGDFNYSETTYEITGQYNVDYESANNWCKLGIIATGDASDIVYAYQVSSDGISYSSISSDADVVGVDYILHKYKYLKMRFRFRSSLWTDTDSLKLIEFSGAFQPFVKGTTITAAHMNENFHQVAVGDLLPIGSSLMVPTTGSYDLGSDTYMFNDIYVTDLYVNSGGSSDYWNIISRVELSFATSRIEFSGLTRTNYRILGMMNIGDDTSTAYVSLNGSSAASYGYAFFNNTVASASQSSIKISSMSSFWIFDIIGNFPVGSEKTIITESNFGYYLVSYLVDGTSFGIYNDTSNTVTSIQIYLNPGTFYAGSTIELWSPL